MVRRTRYLFGPRQAAIFLVVASPLLVVMFVFGAIVFWHDREWTAAAIAIAGAAFSVYAIGAGIRRLAKARRRV